MVCFYLLAVPDEFNRNMTSTHLTGLNPNEFS